METNSRDVLELETAKEEIKQLNQKISLLNTQNDTYKALLEERNEAINEAVNSQSLQIETFKNKELEVLLKILIF